MKWPVNNKPQYGDCRNIWRFAWFPKKMRMFTEDKKREESPEYWVWLEKYHVIQYYSNHGFWFDMYSWIYPDNKKVILG